jgi:threonine dehydrogenase-like Zn-dependent dehydrogenase
LLTCHAGNSAGTTSIDGGQAQYVRVPFADTTLIKAPDSIPNEMLVLMADIFPTGYFAASRYLKDLSPEEAESTVAVVIGCGPVGICAVISALTMVKNVYAIDPNSERLAEAEKLGAKPISSTDDAVDIIKKATNGRGADVVMEVVGRKAALLTALELVRPWGCISSVGIHSESLDLPGPALYAKNVTLAMGRCPVRSVFEDALEVLVSQQEKTRFLTGLTMSIKDAKSAFEIFEKGKVHKIVFDMDLD